MLLVEEIKRKAFHHLALLYMVAYAFLPRVASLTLFAVLVIAAAAVEFLRIRRPELNTYLLDKFGHMHRESEILSPTAVFWTLLGVWVTMVVFTNPKIVLASIGFLVFGDAAAALGGKKWGKRPWGHNPQKTKEGTASFVVAATLWGSVFLKPWVVLPAAGVIGWLESRRMPWNDNFWIPVGSAAVLSVLNLFLGR